MSRESVKEERDRQDQEARARLENWGRWSRTGKPRLGLPSKAAFISDPSPGATVMELDAAHIEDVIIALDALGKKGFGKCALLHFILIEEYINHSPHDEAPSEVGARKVRKKFQRSFCDSSYRKHFRQARLAVNMLAQPL